MEASSHLIQTKAHRKVKMIKSISTTVTRCKTYRWQWFSITIFLFKHDLLQKTAKEIQAPIYLSIPAHRVFLVYPKIQRIFQLYLKSFRVKQKSSRSIPEELSKYNRRVIKVYPKSFRRKPEQFLIIRKWYDHSESCHVSSSILQRFSPSTLSNQLDFTLCVRRETFPTCWQVSHNSFLPLKCKCMQDNV